MTSDLIIRDVPDEARARLEDLAARCGWTLDEYVRRMLIGSSTPEERMRYWDEALASKPASGVSFTRAELLVHLGRDGD